MDPTPYEVPGVDTSKYAGTRGERLGTPIGAIGNSFDSIYGGMFYDRNWTPEDKTEVIPEKEKEDSEGKEEEEGNA